MENANKALLMAGSTLIAVMLFAAFVLFIRNVSIWPEAEGELLSTEQRAKFNEEYEVYEKSLMYGVDVISCLNKAKSNNEKYEEGRAFLSGDAYGIQYHIDVYVRVNQELEENLTVYYYNSAINKEIIKPSETTTGFTMGNMGVSKGKTLCFEKIPEKLDSNKNYTNFYSGTELKTQSKTLKGPDFLQENGGKFSIDLNQVTNSNFDKEKETDGYYSLEYNEESQKQNKKNQKVTCLKNLLSFSSKYMTQIVRNTSEEKEDLEKWTSAKWETALYNFKKRKFTCNSIHYNSSTGLIDEIWFSEK